MDPASMQIIITTNFCCQSGRPDSRAETSLHFAIACSFISDGRSDSLSYQIVTLILFISVGRWESLSYQTVARIIVQSEGGIIFRIGWLLGFSVTSDGRSDYYRHLPWTWMATIMIWVQKLVCSSKLRKKQPTTLRALSYFYSFLHPFLWSVICM